MCSYINPQRRAVWENKGEKRGNKRKFGQGKSAVGLEKLTAECGCCNIFTPRGRYAFF